MKARLELRLQQKLIMTPQLQQAIRLLQLSRLELNQTLSHEMTENPVLEEETSTDAPDDEPSLGEEGVSPKTEADVPEVVEGDTGSLDRLEFNWDSYLDQDEASGSNQSDYRTASSEELPSYEQTLTRPASLADHLQWQLGVSAVTDEERQIGSTIIGNLDEDRKSTRLNSSHIQKYRMPSSA